MKKQMFIVNKAGGEEKMNFLSIKRVWSYSNNLMVLAMQCVAYRENCEK